MHQEQVLPEQPCDAFNIRDQMVNLMLDEGVYRMVLTFHILPGTRLHVQRLAVETTWRCQKNPFIGALGIQEPVIPGEPLFKG